MTGINPLVVISKAQEQRVINLRAGLIKKATPAEKYFRTHIAAKLLRRSKNRFHFKFQREFFIASGVTFIVDFYWSDFKLIVELDGSNHFTHDGRERDKWRQRILFDEYGITTLHFENKRVFNDTESVWMELLEAMVSNEKAAPSQRKWLKVSIERGMMPFIWKVTKKADGLSLNVL